MVTFGPDRREDQSNEVHISRVRHGLQPSLGKHDPDAIVAMHTDDTVFHMHGYAAPATGRGAVRDAIAALFAQVPDLRFENRRVHFGEDHFVSEYEVSGTANGKNFACPGADVFTLRDGRIARKDTYIDWLAYQRQVGADLAAPPAGS